MGVLSQVSKAKERSARQDVGTGAAVLGTGYATSAAARHKEMDDVIDYVSGGRHLTPGQRRMVKAGGVAGRGARGAVIGGAGGLVVNALRSDKDVGKAYRPTNPLEGALRTRRQMLQTPIGRKSQSPFRTGMEVGRHRAATVSTNPEFNFGNTQGQRIAQLKARGVSKSVGVGRKEKTDGLTSRAVVLRTPTLRDINGKFAGEGKGVKVFHPSFSGSRRPPRGSQLQHWKKGGDSTSKPWVSKADDERKGMLRPVELANMAAHTGARVGRRL